VSLWRDLLLCLRIAGWLFVGVAAVGIFGWATGGDPHHGVAPFVLITVFGLLAGAVCLTIGHVAKPRG
jgi:hypothetical protein